MISSADHDVERKAARHIPALRQLPRPSTVVAPVPAPESAVAPPAEVAAAGGSNGVWEPPRLLVRLVELPQMDQIAVRLAPTETGDGKLDCDLKLAPVYDLLVTQVEATPK